MRISSITHAAVGVAIFIVPLTANAEENGVLITGQAATEAENRAREYEKFSEAILLATRGMTSDQTEVVTSTSTIETCGCDSANACGDRCDDYRCGGGVDCDTTCGDEDDEEIGCLQGMLSPCSPLVIGGWSSFGYHNNNTRQSFADGDLLAYNDVPDRFNLQQGWFYIGKEADGSQGLDFGFRFDAVYGTDAQLIQATGNPGAQTAGTGTYDASLDHGIYGWAMPQLYGEVAYGDWSVIGGYFIALLGYESVQAPQNFFYSHSLTMFNSEAFTHTGVLAKYKGYDGLTLYGGWSLGWDTGFDQNFGGSNFLGGFSLDLTDSAKFHYYLEAGDFGYRGENAYNHSLVLELELSDKLEYAVQSDYINANDSFGVTGITVEEFGVNQYLYYQLSDNWWIGGRAEWWKSNSATGIHQSYYEVTGGLNYQPRSNLVIRPEIRYDWTPGEENYAATVAPDYNQWVTGIDVVFKF